MVDPDLLFATERLFGRRLRAGDVADMAAVYGDADAMRFVGDGEPLDLQRCSEWLQVTANNIHRRGYGMSAMVERASGVVVGFCGLVHPGGQVEPEIKYAFKRGHWGRGFATEAVQGMLDYGERVHGLRRVIATVNPAHRVSQHVLAKAGLRQAAPRHNDDGSISHVFVWEAGGLHC